MQIDSSKNIGQPVVTEETGKQRNHAYMDEDEPASNQNPQSSRISENDKNADVLAKQNTLLQKEIERISSESHRIKSEMESIKQSFL